MKNIICSLLFCACTTLVWAQESSPPVPKNTCVKPAEPAKDAALEKLAEFKGAVFSYKSCLENYLDDLEKLSSPYLEAGNAAVGEYNAYTKKIKFADPKPADAAKK